MINEFHYKRVCNLLKDHGGKVLHGNPNAHLDFNLKPTIVLNPNKNSQLMKEEIFGPIFPILTYKDINEAINYISEE
jgi:aldehyde dehydrogenase (NAD+)